MLLGTVVATFGVSLVLGLVLFPTALLLSVFGVVLTNGVANAIINGALVSSTAIVATGAITGLYLDALDASALREVREVSERETHFLLNAR